MLAQDNQVCFTFDDLPVTSEHFKDIDFQTTITKKLLSTLKKYHIPAIGFLNGCNVRANDYSPLQMWLENDMEIGNHTFSHLDYHTVSLQEFIADFQKCEQELIKVNENFNNSAKYFRHPYLHTGETKEKADSLRRFLINSSYREAPVTIDHSDWIFSLAYDNARVKGDTLLMQKMGKTYLDFAEQKLKYIEGQADKLFNRRIKHILLLHANTINADYLDDIAAIYKKNDYRFISLDEALTDEVYDIELTVFVEGGIPWLDRWALAAGKKGDFFKDEPTPPDFIMKLANVDIK
jgi:peptidoglycan/xylan/chitin deacetylase (PgdA/CDA1 family)